MLTFGLLRNLSDSTVLAHVMSVLNKRYDYGLDLFLLSIDEGITGYRDDSLEVSCTLYFTSAPAIVSFLLFCVYFPWKAWTVD